MNNILKKTNINWCPYIKQEWNLGKVKNVFFISKEKANDSNPIVLKLARSSIQVRDISTNEGQMAASYNDYNPVKIGDLLLNPMDLYSGANCNVSEIEGVISPAYANLRAKKMLNPKYYDYYFKFQYWTMAMFAHGKGVSFDNRWTINSESILNYEIPLLSLEEQNKIVNEINNKVNNVDELISNQEQQIAKLKQYKQSLITEVVTKGLNPNVKMKSCKFSYFNNIPLSWEEKKIKKVVELKTGKTPPSERQEYFNGNINWFTPGDFQKDIIYNSERKLTQRAINDCSITLYPKYTTLLIGIGGTAGKVALMNAEGYSNQQITAIIPNNIHSSYLFYYMTSIQKYLKDNALYTTMPIINNQYLGNIGIIIPPLDEQKEIVNFLDDKVYHIDKLIQIKNTKIEKLNEYKKSLIYEYVTGKKEVTC